MELYLYGSKLVGACYALLPILGGYFYYRHKFSSGSSRIKLPPGSAGFPILGETISFFKVTHLENLYEWFQARIDKYGPVFRTSILGSNLVVVTGQAGNKFIFSSSNSNGLKHSQPASAVRILGKHSIFELSGMQYKLVRGAIVNFLRPESIKDFVGKMDSIVQNQISQELQGKDSVKVVLLMKKITFRVVCSILIGLPEDEVIDELLDYFTTAVKGTWSVPYDLPGTTFRKSFRARRWISEYILQVIEQRRKGLENGTVKSGDDLISSFLVLRDDDGAPLSDETIVDNLFTVMIASHDTSSTLLAFLIRHLARDLDCYSKVTQEQIEVVQAKGAQPEINWSDLQKMKYTWRVAQEIMRLNPPILGNYRRAERDTVFGGYDIPKGWQVLWMAPGTHMDKHIFKDPEKFDPTRFENPSNIPSYAYVPFGAGSRICPGAEFGRIEVLLILHHMVLNYQWSEMIPGEPIIRTPLPNPAMGLPIKLFPRKKLRVE